MKSILMSVLILALCAGLWGAQQARSPEVQLKAAVQKEEVEGDLKAAIDLYSKLAQGADRAVAAKALIRMGECYDKLGESQAMEAQKAYERVVRDFADQKEPLAAAQKHLAEKAGQPEPSVTVQRIATFADQRRYTSISRDGRLLVYCKDDGVYVYDPVKNEDRRIVPKATQEERLSYARFFPDGKQVAYLVNLVSSQRSEIHTIGIDGSNPRLVTSRKSGGKEHESISEIQLSPDGKQIAFNEYTRVGDYDQESIYVMNTDGSNQRLLFRAEKDEGSDDFAWSPDGKHLLLWLWNDEHQERSRTVLVSVADGSSRVIASQEQKAAFSPDGRSIAIHLADNFKTLVAEGLYLTAVDSAKEVLLVKGAASHPIWTPDGKRILFRSRRPDQSDIRSPKPYPRLEPFDLYSIRVADGKPEGKPELMQKDVLMPGTVFDPTPDGNIYFCRNPYQSPNVYVADLDPATGKAVSKPDRLNRTFIDSSAGPPRWSPDGQRLAYSKFDWASLMMPLMIKSTATGEEHELTISPPFTAWGRNGLLQWFPDNRSLLSFDHINGRFVFRKVDVKTGQQQLFFERPGDEALWGMAALSPDGRVIFFSLSKPAAPQSADQKIAPMNALRLMCRNLETGEEKELFQAQSPSRVTGFHMALSFDGRRLAFTRLNTDNTTSLLWMPSDGGEARELYRSERLMNECSWTKDGRHILVVQSDPANGMQQLWSVSVETGEGVSAGLTFPKIGGTSLHPDGRRFTFIGWQPRPTELWVMKLLFPSPKP